MDFGTRQVTIGGLVRAQLQHRLVRTGVQLNEYAKMLLAHRVFDEIVPVQELTVVSRNLQQLDLDAGATLPQIFDRAISHGLQLCSPITGPYLRLAYLTQSTSSDSVLSAGKSPVDSLTIASSALGDEEFPRGFYLRVVDGVPWLRGYRCDDTHGFSLDDTFIFQLS